MRDYAGRTAHLTMLEDGAYNRLLDWQYINEKPLPADRERRYAIAKAMTPAEREAVDKIAEEFFSDGGWQERVQAEIRAARPRILAAINNGSKSKGRPRAPHVPHGTMPAGAPLDTQARTQERTQSQPTGMPVGELSILHTKDKSVRAARAAQASPNFIAFWQLYPKKRNKPQALKAWTAINNGCGAEADPLCVHSIMAGLARSKRCADWLRDDGRFVPYPASWLNARGWEDDIAQPADGAHAVPLLPPEPLHVQCSGRNVMGGVQYRCKNSAQAGAEHYGLCVPCEELVKFQGRRRAPELTSITGGLLKKADA